MAPSNGETKLRTDSWKTKLRTNSWKTKHADKNEDRLRASHPCFAQAAISQAQEPNLCSMGEQLRTSTQEKQTCAICLQTIRKNAVWWHVTECKHYFHYDCWHSYRKHECDRREGTHTRVKCPACRHPQISEAEFMAVMVPLMERALGSRQ